MKLPIIGILSGVALATIGISSAAQAAFLIPPPGVSQYRLVFVTEGTRDATSTNIADYNNFVNNAALASGPLTTALNTAGLAPSSLNWRAIASTAAVNVRVNTSTLGTGGVPIYRLDGTKVADDYGDLWDGDIDAAISQTELDNTKPNTAPEDRVWTGSNQFGAILNPLGGTIGTSGRRGGALETDFRWISGGTESITSTRLRSLYAISRIINVPEPSMVLSFITLGGLVLGGAVRGVRK